MLSNQEGTIILNKNALLWLLVYLPKSRGGQLLISHPIWQERQRHFSANQSGDGDISRIVGNKIFTGICELWSSGKNRNACYEPIHGNHRTGTEYRMFGGWNKEHDNFFNTLFSICTKDWPRRPIPGSCLGVMPPPQQPRPQSHSIESIGRIFWETSCSDLNRSRDCRVRKASS
jgi:hypothetical protein